MKAKHVILLFVLVIIGSSCSSMSWMGFSSEKLMKIQKGMNQKEVRNVFGNPAFRRFDAAIEEWEYRVMTVDGGWSVAVVRFLDDKVFSLNTFYETKPLHGPSTEKPSRETL